MNFSTGIGTEPNLGPLSFSDYGLELRHVDIFLHLRYNLSGLDGLGMADATQRIRRCTVQRRDTSYLMKFYEGLCTIARESELGYEQNLGRPPGCRTPSE
jgi:hypothetical protein